MREKRQSTASARVLTARVLARPGTPSMRTWPPARRARISRSTRPSCPTSTFATSERTASKRSLMAPMSGIAPGVDSAFIRSRPRDCLPRRRPAASFDRSRSASRCRASGAARHGSLPVPAAAPRSWARRHLAPGAFAPPASRFRRTRRRRRFELDGGELRGFKRTPARDRGRYGSARPLRRPVRSGLGLGPRRSAVGSRFSGAMPPEPSVEGMVRVRLSARRWRRLRRGPRA